MRCLGTVPLQTNRETDGIPTLRSEQDAATKNRAYLCFGKLPLPLLLLLLPSFLGCFLPAIR